MFEPAERLKNVKVSASAAMTRKVRELRAQGVKIVGLSSGEPDIKLCRRVAETADAHLRNRHPRPLPHLRLPVHRRQARHRPTRRPPRRDPRPPLDARTTRTRMTPTRKINTR